MCAAEAEELNNRLQSSKQRVSELERTLSSVSTQQKQFEKVADAAAMCDHKLAKKKKKKHADASHGV